MNMNHLIRIVIIEDNPYVREGWQTFIDMENDMCVLACFESVEDALKSKELNQTDIIIMDIDLPGMSGIEGVKHIMKLDIDPTIIMATIHDDDDNIFQALKAGAMGYMVKKTSPEKLVEALRDAHAGGAPMTPNIARKVIGTFHAITSPDEEQLTERELQILNELATGRSYAEIGKKIFLSTDGVRHHIRKIYRKLEVHSRSEAISKGMNRNLINLDSDKE
jgi:DNA-binding NarL/FixJ family response regulator